MENRVERRNLSDIRSLKRKIFLMLGIQRAYLRAPASISIHEEEDIRAVSPDYRHLHQVETALLEVENQKAEAMMKIERQRIKIF